MTRKKGPISVAIIIITNDNDNELIIPVTKNDFRTNSFNVHIFYSRATCTPANYLLQKLILVHLLGISQHKYRSAKKTHNKKVLIAAKKV